MTHFYFYIKYVLIILACATPPACVKALCAKVQLFFESTKIHLNSQFSTIQYTVKPAEQPNIPETPDNPDDPAVYGVYVFI